MTRRKDPPAATPENPGAPDDPGPKQPGTATLAAEAAASDGAGADVPGVEADRPLTESTPGTASAEPAGPARRSGILGPLLGGALAAIGGFAAAHFDVLNLRDRDASADLAALAARLDEAEARSAAAAEAARAELARLADRVSALESAPAPEAADPTRLDRIEERLAALETVPADGSAGTAALAARLSDLERRLTDLPATGPSPEIQRQLDDALARLDAAEAEAKARAAEAESAAETARRSKALDALAAAIETGQPFSAELQALADPDLTAALGTLASAGVPTLARLQADFPDAAREALRIARRFSGEDSWSDRVLDFLAAQTEARPLTPQEGSTPEAILSRAEFALSEGRVADALAELSALDPSVQAPFADWIPAATAHVETWAALRSARGE